MARRCDGSRLGGIDHDRADPAPVERQRERQPDQPAAEDDDVRLFHGIYLGS